MVSILRRLWNRHRHSSDVQAADQGGIIPGAEDGTLIWAREQAGFSLDDAPVLGLLVRIWKLLKEVIRYYEENNAEFIGLLERPIIEAATTATYLMKGNEELLLDIAVIRQVE